MRSAQARWNTQEAPLLVEIEAGGLPGAVPVPHPLVEALFGLFEQGAAPRAPALAARGLSPGLGVEPGELVVSAEFGCDLLEAAPLAL